MYNTNKKISEYLKAKDGENLDNLQRPCTVFISFEAEEGYQRALLYNEVIDFRNKEDCTREMVVYNKFVGEDIQIEDAPEPTDIIWEN